MEGGDLATKVNFGPLCSRLFCHRGSCVTKLYRLSARRQLEIGDRLPSYLSSLLTICLCLPHRSCEI